MIRMAIVVALPFSVPDAPCVAVVTVVDLRRQTLGLVSQRLPNAIMDMAGPIDQLEPGSIRQQSRTGRDGKACIPFHVNLTGLHGASTINWRLPWEILDTRSNLLLEQRQHITDGCPRLIRPDRLVR